VVKIVAQVGSATIAEQAWKKYKNIVSKKRTGLGLERTDGSCSGPRLASVKGSLHLEEFSNVDAHAEEAFLRDFSIGDEAKFVKTFTTTFSALVSITVFKCYIEEWEDPSDKTLTDLRGRVMEFKLTDKYDGMFIYDDEEDEHRKIVNVDWVNRKGYQVVTVLVGSENDATKNMGYLINSELPLLIKAGENAADLKLLMSATEATAWEVGRG
jgi:hypothetical protein